MVREVCVCDCVCVCGKGGGLAVGFAVPACNRTHTKFMHAGERRRLVELLVRDFPDVFAFPRTTTTRPQNEDILFALTHDEVATVARVSAWIVHWMHARMYVLAHVELGGPKVLVGLV